MAYTKATPHLHCAQSFRDAAQEFIDAVCNGCGARDGINVPDTMWGMSITRACNIHDWDYQAGSCLSDKAVADGRFRCNVETLIEHAYKTAPRWQRFTGIARLLRWLRGWRAQTYYMAVRYHGLAAFRAGKD